MTAPTSTPPGTNDANTTAMHQASARAAVPLGSLVARLRRNNWALPAKAAVPALHGVMLSIGAQALVLDSFDYEVACTSRVAADTTGEGARLVNGRKLQDVLKHLDSALDVTITFEGEHVVLAQGRTRAVLPTLPAEDYPEPSPRMTAQSKTAPRFSLPGTDFLALATRAFTVAGQDSTTPALTGAQFDLAAGTLTVVACDRFRLAISETAVTTEQAGDTEALVPARTLHGIAKHFGAKHLVTVTLDSRPDSQLAALEADGSTFTIRLIDAAYPSWRDVTPTTFAGQYTVATAAAMRATQIVAAAVPSKIPISVTFADTTATLTAGWDGDTQLSHDIDATDGHGSWQGSVALNPEYLTAAFKSLGSATARIHVNGTFKPVMLSSDETPGYRLLIYTVRTN